MNITKYKRDLKNIIDDGNAGMDLFHKGVKVGTIQPKIREYWSIDDIINEWTSFEMRCDDQKSYKGEVFYIWIEDVMIYFDDYKIWSI